MASVAPATFQYRESAPLFSLGLTDKVTSLKPAASHDRYRLSPTRQAPTPYYEPSNQDYRPSPFD